MDAHLSLIGPPRSAWAGLLAVTAPACLNTLNPQGALTTSKAFGVGRAFRSWLPSSHSCWRCRF